MLFSTVLSFSSIFSLSHFHCLLLPIFVTHTHPPLPYHHPPTTYDHKPNSGDIKCASEILWMLHPDRVISYRDPYGGDLLDTVQSLITSEGRAMALNRGHLCSVLVQVFQFLTEVDITELVNDISRRNEEETKKDTEIELVKNGGNKNELSDARSPVTSALTKSPDDLDSSLLFLDSYLAQDAKRPSQITKREFLMDTPPLVGYNSCFLLSLFLSSLFLSSSPLSSSPLSSSLPLFLSSFQYLSLALPALSLSLRPLSLHIPSLFFLSAFLSPPLLFVSNNKYTTLTSVPILSSHPLYSNYQQKKRKL